MPLHGPWPRNAPDSRFATCKDPQGASNRLYRPVGPGPEQSRLEVWERVLPKAKERCNETQGCLKAGVWDTHPRPGWCRGHAPRWFSLKCIGRGKGPALRAPAAAAWRSRWQDHSSSWLLQEYLPLNNQAISQLHAHSLSCRCFGVELDLYPHRYWTLRRRTGAEIGLCCLHVCGPWQ